MMYNTGNFEKHTTKNPLKRILVNRLNKHMLSDIGDYLSELGGREVSVLDAGCGEGFTDKLLMNKFPNIKIIGLEYTKEAIRIAEKMNPGVEYVQGNICDMPFENKQFDIVICSEVLEHLETPQKAMLEIVRVAKGLMYLSVPHEPWFCLGNIMALKNLSRFGNPIDHINHWTKHSFKRFIRRTDGREWIVTQSFPWLIAHYKM